MLSIVPIENLPEIEPGCDLGVLFADALADHEPSETDILVITQKIVSKARNRFVSLTQMDPSREAAELAATTGKDPRFVELVLRESIAVVRAVPGVLITRHRSGHVMANAGIDRSNLGQDDSDTVILLPVDSDFEARAIREGIGNRFGCSPAIVISDSFGRPWRYGVTNVAIGADGMPAMLDRRGGVDRDGRSLEVTQVCLADMIASAAGLVMGEGAEGIPAALVRGMDFDATQDIPASAIIRPVKEDLFR
ncbi:F420-0--gamma-glutamyl ligase [Novosphingobium marinum]|uniref:Coenzyme F420-0:L-glutamate ligase/coenzyme F420-1:gamma-L-glutamate ligase n=1 Tax=Novosphingobium marinum TaxID=1514948 RepID=A0A7Y9XYY5_9SPHN|nr:coenzyme F420-0:L-glutamate ligase [Novosphingobium marinum]NYH95521.1 coenzyme F420-0:L-glutamate ligase/coenzyme F420-1:gamma-L-glutamate ligase [Novosphingobium marinum]GGC27716.1 F420-0--gamma-glutamyl ligase [Novosphingobium marinum]